MSPPVAVIVGDGGKEVEDKSALFFAITGLYKYCPTIEPIDMGLSYSACIIGAVVAVDATESVIP